MTNPKQYNLYWAIAILIFACVVAYGLTGCTTIQKFFHKETAKVDSTTHTRTDSLAYHQKIVKEGYGLSVHYDTGCTNTFTFNPLTGLIQATGNVTGASVQGKKKEAQTDSVRLVRERQDRYIKESVTKLVTKKVTRLPWWVWLAGIGGLAYVVYRLYKIFPFRLSNILK